MRDEFAVEDGTRGPSLPRTGSLATTSSSANHREAPCSCGSGGQGCGGGGWSRGRRSHPPPRGEASESRLAFPGKPCKSPSPCVETLGVYCFYLIPNCRLNYRLYFPVGISWLPDSTVIIIICIILTTVVYPNRFSHYNLSLSSQRLRGMWGRRVYSPSYFYILHCRGTDWKTIGLKLQSHHWKVHGDPLR